MESVENITDTEQENGLLQSSILLEKIKYMGFTHNQHRLHFCY